MREFADGLRAEKMRSGNAALYMLKEQFELFSTSPHKIEACESIASCFAQLGQYGEAAGWYEAAGRLILSQPSLVPTTKALSALGDLEKALDFYSRGEDEDGFTEVSTLVRDLKRACASA